MNTAMKFASCTVVAICIVLLAIAVWRSTVPFRGKPVVHPGPDQKTLVNSASRIKNGVLQVLTNNDWLAPSYPVPPRLSFAMPGTPDFGINPKTEVFNQAGGNVRPPSFRFIVSNGNRVDGAGSEASDMLLVVPDLDAETCRAIAVANGGAAVNFVLTFNLTPYPVAPAGPSPVLGKPSDCIQFKGRYYFYDTLLAE